MSANAIVCHHEAGHAVAALACGLHFRDVRISSTGAGATRGFRGLTDAPEQYLMARYLTACGGPIAEAFFLAGFERGDNSADAWHRGSRLADTACWSGDIRFLQTVQTRIPQRANQRAFDHALRGVARNWSAITRIAKVLAGRRVLSRDEIQILISKGESR